MASPDYISVARRVKWFSRFSRSARQFRPANKTSHAILVQLLRFAFGDDTSLFPFSLRPSSSLFSTLSTPMPFHRPTSPLTLETYSAPPNDDIDSDGVLGSDDELDEDACLARHQRIEKLAEAYLQGTPLFILSASLKGPFDQGWVNPWRKRRKPERSHNGVEESTGPVVQETDPRPRNQFHELQEGSRHASPSVPPSDAPSEASRVSSKRQRTHRSSRDKQGRVSVSSQGTPKRTVPWTADTQLNSQLRDTSIARPQDDKWLKRDRKRIGFRDFDPPTSPTTTLSTRHTDTRNHTVRPLLARRQSPVSSHKSQGPVKADERQSASSPANQSGEKCRSESIVHSHPLHNTRPSPFKQQTIPHSVVPEAQSGETGPETSFCVVSSSSQLPKFEYRRRKKRKSDKKRESKSSSIQQAENAPLYVTKNADEPPQQEPAHLNLSVDPNLKNSQVRNEQNAQPVFKSTDTHSLVSRFDSRLGQGQLESRTIHGNTSDNIPSAQPVPPNPALTDYAPSLHSTALPAASSEDDSNTGPDPHLSTQAALLNAQRSFQDGLDSPDEDRPATSGRKRRPSQSSAVSSANSHNITPFYRLDKARPDVNDGSGKVAAMPSTQYMVDATTPFTFSTEKKRHVHIGSSSRIPSSKKKQKTASFMNSSSPGSPLPWSPTQENRPNSIQPDSKGSPRISRHESPHSHNVPVQPSQTTALPLTLSGSPPPTGQDGQGDIGGESFNLSQAIADAGSWLQESFDINQDLRHLGNNSGPPSTGNAQRSVLSLDTH